MTTHLAIYPHGYTGHGHRCCKQAPAQRPPEIRSIARCGGPGMCEQCADDRDELHATAPDEEFADLISLRAELGRLRQLVRTVEACGIGYLWQPASRDPMMLDPAEITVYIGAPQEASPAVTIAATPNPSATPRGA